MDRNAQFILDENVSLEEVQNLIKELQLVEKNIKYGPGRDPETVEYDLETGMIYLHLETESLLPVEELPNLDEVLAGQIDGGRMALPYKDRVLSEYPSDFTDIMDYMDAHFIGVRYKLLNYVKAVINEEMLAKIYSNQSSCQGRSPHAKPSPTSQATMRRRKNSFTVPLNDSSFSDPSNLTDSPIILTPKRAPTFMTPDGIQITLPVITDHSSTPIHGQSTEAKYSSNTYSKKTSPFAVRTSRQHPTMPFTPNNGNISDEDFQTPQKDVNINLQTRFMNRTMTLPNRINSPLRSANQTYMLSPETPVSNNRIGQPGSNGSVNNISLEELNSIARLQEESLISGRNFTRKDTQVVSQRSSFDEEEGSASTSNPTWSNDTFSVGQSKTPSDSSSGISSPPTAESYEDVQMAPETLRRSMPNLTPKHLSMTPQGHDKLHREARYNSDLKLPENRTRTRTLRHPTAGNSHVQHNYSFPGEGEPNEAITHTYPQFTSKPNPLEPLKKALTRGDTFHMDRGNGAYSPSDSNGYNSVQNQSGKPSLLKPPTQVSRLRPPRVFTANARFGCGAQGGIRPSTMIPGPPSAGSNRLSLPATADGNTRQSNDITCEKTYPPLQTMNAKINLLPSPQSLEEEIIDGGP